MGLAGDIKTQFQSHASLSAIEVWQDKVPGDKASVYPRCVMSVLPTSGRQRLTFDTTSYENADVRLEVFDVTNENIDTYKSAMESKFGSKSRFALTSGYCGMCQRTSSFTRYAGTDRAREIYVAVLTCRITIQKTN